METGKIVSLTGMVMIPDLCECCAIEHCGDIKYLRARCVKVYSSSSPTNPSIVPKKVPKATFFDPPQPVIPSRCLHPLSLSYVPFSSSVPPPSSHYQPLPLSPPSKRTCPQTRTHERSHLRPQPMPLSTTDAPATLALTTTCLKTPATAPSPPSVRCSGPPPQRSIPGLLLPLTAVWRDSGSRRNWTRPFRRQSRWIPAKGISLSLSRVVFVRHRT